MKPKGIKVKYFFFAALSQTFFAPFFCRFAASFF
jgi:hypothetical protein